MLCVADTNFTSPLHAYHMHTVSNYISIIHLHRNKCLKSWLQTATVKITYETNFKYPTEQIRSNSITYDIYNRFTPYTLYV